MADANCPYAPGADESARVLVIGAFADSVITFRGPLLAALVATGCAVDVAAPGLSAAAPVRNRLEAMGVGVHDIPLSRQGMNPLRDIGTVVSLYRLIGRCRPSHVLAYTIKPIVYGLIAARLRRVEHRFALITGLGHALRADQDPAVRLLRGLVRGLYAQALRGCDMVFFQNPDDAEYFRCSGIVAEAAPTTVLNGSGVDLEHFSPVSLPERASFLLIARLLKAKGVREYVEAARIVRRSGGDATFALAGWVDESSDAISQGELDGWIAEGVVDYLGRLDDVREAIGQCAVFVLPSYGEGTPRAVLEAMAMGRPIITTDAPGCRETVVDGENGFMVPVKSVDSLVDAMQRFIDAPELVAAMGHRSREIAEEKYDVHKVNAVMLRKMGL